jgi:hypothetical protein
MRTPDSYLLDEYYTLWKRGLRSSEIQTRLDMTDYLFQKYQPYFFNHIRNEMKAEAREGEFSIELTEELANEFLDYIRAGIPYDKVAKAMNIPLPTVMNVWFKDDVFKAEVDYALEMANVKVIKALHKRACGYTFTAKSKTTTSTKNKRNKETGDLEDIEVTSVTEREEHVLPEVNAIKFWLINRSNEQWALDGSTSKSNNKGAILSAIDDMTELNDEDKAELDPKDQEIAGDLDAPQP